MAVPSSSNAQLFYRAANERYEDASVLLRLNRTTGAIYLAGYGVENMLKALIIASVPRAQEEQIIAQFRGNQAHSYEWLLATYRGLAGGTIPNFLRLHFSRVTIWSTTIRYKPDTVDRDTAVQIFQSVDAIIQWADGRLT